MGDGDSSKKARGGAAASRDAPVALDVAAPRGLSLDDIDLNDLSHETVARLQQTITGNKYLVAVCSARLLDSPSENECRGVLGVIRACRDSMSWLLKEADIEARQGLAAQIDAERAERNKRESGVSRASADVALSAFPSAGGH